MTMQERQLLAYGEMDEADAMSGWFSDYLDGIYDEPPAELPITTIQRLQRLFESDADDVTMLLCQARDALLVLPALHQMNIASFLCGYSEDMLETLPTDATIEESVDAFRDLLATNAKQPKIIDQQSSPVLVLEDQRLSQESEPAWREDALCAQIAPEMFFPEKGGSVREAKAICRICDVAEQCLQYALDTEMNHGIWGGLTVRERRKLLRLGLTAQQALAARQTN